MVLAVMGVNAQQGPAATGAVAVAAATTQEQAAAANIEFNNWAFYICGILVVVVGGYKIVLESVRYVRHLACLSSDTQRYFSAPAETYAMVKKQIIYAPVFRKRHNREFQLSSAVNMVSLTWFMYKRT